MTFPVMVDSNDTLRINTKSVDDCVLHLRENYIGIVGQMVGRDYFYQIWGANRRIMDAYSLFVCDFNSETGKYATTKKIQFKTGETLTLEYTRVLGLVVEKEDSITQPEKYDSDGYPLAKKQIIPVSLLSCEKCEDFPIVIE